MTKRIAPIGAALACAALAGTGLAARPATTPASAAQQPQAAKVTVCHKGRVTIRIAPSAVAAHKAHGDQPGPCKA